MQLWLSRRDLCVPRQCRSNLDGTFGVRFASAWPSIAFYTHNSVLRATCRYRVETWISLNHLTLQAPIHPGTISPAGQPRSGGSGGTQLRIRVHERKYGDRTGEGMPR